MSPSVGLAVEVATRAPKEGEERGVSAADT